VPLPDEKADILRKASASGTLDIALHGYSHQTTRADEMMEFSGVGYQTQLEKIAAGRKFLEEITGAPISSFVPPWNRYDKGTLRALQDHGFSTLSAGQQGDAPSDIPLKFLPATCDLLRVREAVRIARDAAVAEPVIVVLFHDYDFSEVNAARGKSNYQSLFDLLRWLRQQRDVRLLSISEATRVIGDLSINRFLFCQSKPACVY
jgi:peptidoglycan/xylan/chitin deacetylase (PgdA/CDA1 family)